MSTVSTLERTSSVSDLRSTDYEVAESRTPPRHVGRPVEPDLDALAAEIVKTWPPLDEQHKAELGRLLASG
jgi:hypothetical protein